MELLTHKLALSFLPSKAAIYRVKQNAAIENLNTCNLGNI